MPHGNSKTEREYVRTCPSVIQEISTQVKEKNAISVYQNMISQGVSPGKEAVMLPRNPKQVENQKVKIDNDNIASRDDIYNLYLLAAQLNSFIKKITIYPDVEFICANDWILGEFNKLLELLILIVI